MRRISFRALAVLFALAPAREAQAQSAARPAAELAPQPYVEPAHSEPLQAASIPRVSAWLGAGALWVPSDGLDVFSEDDALATFGAGAALSVARAGGLDLAAVAAWSMTGSEAVYRTQPASLEVMRLALGPELRASLTERLFWHARVSPTLTRLAAELDESSSSATLSDALWRWGVDAAIGVDLRFIETDAALPEALGFFVRLDAGYAWVQSTRLALAAEDGAAPVRTQDLKLPELALAGPFFSASFGAGF